MSASVINQVLALESNRIGSEILKKTTHISPILDLIPQGKWPEGMGNSIQVLTFGRTLPASTYSEGAAVNSLAYDSSFWTAINSSLGFAGDGNTNNCSPPTIQVKQGHDLVSFNLEHSAVESQRFCVLDLMNAFQRNRQLEAVKQNLSDVTSFILTEKFRRDLVYWTDNKVVVKTNGVTESTASGGVAGAHTFNTGGAIQTAGSSGQGFLTQALLTRWHQKLVRRGAGPGALTKEDGSPVFGLLCSAETSRLLKLESGIRDDYRYNDARVNELLAPLGSMSKPVLGYQHIIDITPPRWNWDGDSWVKVEPYYVTAAETGWKIEENPDYETAGWEDSIIFHKDVIEIVFPGSQGNSGGMSFTPVNYRGEWKFNNILNETTNPDGTMGYFRGVFVLGAMPRYTNYAVVIRHARCEPNPLYAACS